MALTQQEQLLASLLIGNNPQWNAHTSKLYEKILRDTTPDTFVADELLVLLSRCGASMDTLAHVVSVSQGRWMSAPTTEQEHDISERLWSFQKFTKFLPVSYTFTSQHTFFLIQHGVALSHLLTPMVVLARSGQPEHASIVSAAAARYPKHILSKLLHLLSHRSVLFGQQHPHLASVLLRDVDIPQAWDNNKNRQLPEYRLFGDRVVQSVMQGDPAIAELVVAKLSPTQRFELANEYVHLLSVEFDDNLRPVLQKDPCASLSAHHHLTQHADVLMQPLSDSQRRHIISRFLGLDIRLPLPPSLAATASKDDLMSHTTTSNTPTTIKKI